MYAEVDFICDRKPVNSGNQDVCIGDMFASKEDLIAAMFEDMLKKTGEIEAAIQTKDDCILLAVLVNTQTGQPAVPYRK